MKPMLRQACLATLLCLCVHQARATANAEITITGLRFDLVDLTPDDGVAPGLVMPEDALSYSGGSAEFGAMVIDQGYSAFLHPVELDVTKPEGHVLLQVDASTILASSQSVTPAEVNGVLNLYTNNSFITLLPNSALHITGLVTSKVQTDGAVVGGSTYVGTAFLGLLFYGTASGGGALDMHLSNHPYGVPEVLTEQKQIDFLLQNNSNTNKTVQMDLDMSAYSHVTAVPEPGAIALAMGGLLTAGAGVRTRRRRVRAGSHQ
jgi:hypothetical protein